MTYKKEDVELDEHIRTIRIACERNKCTYAELLKMDYLKEIELSRSLLPVPDVVPE